MAPYSFRSAWTLQHSEDESTRSKREGVPKLLELFQALFADTQHTPKTHLGGSLAVQKYNNHCGEARIRLLHEMECQFLERVDEVSKLFPAVAKALDKPNLHRLLELYVHTLPMVGNISHVQELLFEGAHQPLKRAIQKSNKKDAQLQAMEHRLSNDWKQILAVETGDVLQSGEGWDEDS